MSVELLDTPRFHGFRVRRQIDGKTYQEYFSLKDGGKRMRGNERAAVKTRAEERDTELARQQRSAKDKSAREVHVDERGRNFVQCFAGKHDGVARSSKFE